MTSALQLWWQGRHGNLVPSGAVRWRSQECGSQERRDVETSPRAPCVVPSQMVLMRRSGLSKQWDLLPSSLCDLSSKEATQSLGQLLLGCLGEATHGCVLTTKIWQNISNKETNPTVTRPPNKEHWEYLKLMENRPIVSARHILQCNI